MANIDLKHIVVLECRLSCMSAITHAGLCRLSVTNGSTQRVSTVIRALPTPPQDLYSLILDFFPDEHNVLANIAFACPRLRKLKLIEQEQSLVCMSFTKSYI